MNKLIEESLQKLLSELEKAFDDYIIAVQNDPKLSSTYVTLPKETQDVWWDGLEYFRKNLDLGGSTFTTTSSGAFCSKIDAAEAIDRIKNFLSA